MATAEVRGRDRRRPDSQQAGARVPAVIAATQIVAWGVTFYPVSVLAPWIADGLGVPVPLASAAPTVLLVGTALASIPTARLLTRFGARRVTSLGTLIGAIALGLVAASTSVWSYLAGWLLAGLVGAAMLTLGAQVSVAEFRPHTAPRDLRLMMLATCLPPALFWPLTNGLAVFGWRVVFGVYAALLLVCALALVILLPRTSTRLEQGRAPRRTDPGPGQSSVPAPPAGRFLPLVGAISLNGFVSGGLSLVFIPLFIAAGVDVGLAVTIASALGLVQAGARALTLTLRVPAIVEVLAASGVMFAGVATLLLLPTAGATAAVVAVALFGAGAGVIAVARAVLPHELFDAESYAHVSGAISLPLNLVFAVAPTLFVALLTVSASLVVGLALVLVAGAIGCLLVLQATIRQDSQR